MSGKIYKIVEDKEFYRLEWQIAEQEGNIEFAKTCKELYCKIPLIDAT